MLPVRRRGFSAMVSSSKAQEVEFDHTNLDLAKLIECRATVPEYSRPYMVENGAAGTGEARLATG